MEEKEIRRRFVLTVEEFYNSFGIKTIRDGKVKLSNISTLGNIIEITTIEESKRVESI